MPDPNDMTDLKRRLARAQDALDRDCAYLRGKEVMASEILKRGPETQEEETLLIQLAHLGSRLLCLYYAERVVDDAELPEEFWDPRDFY